MRSALITALAVGGWALATAAAQAAAPGYHVVAKIPGPDGGWDYVRVDTANNQVLVARGTSVMRLNLDTLAVTGGLAPGQGLHDPYPVNRGAEVAVTNGGANTVVFVNAKTFETIATVPSGKNPDAANFDAKTGLLLAMDHSGGTVTLMDPKAHKAVATIEVGGQMEGAAFDGTGKAYVNVEDTNQIAVIDIAGRKVLARYALDGCKAPTGITYDAANKQILTACNGSTLMLDAPTGKILATLSTGAGADGIAFDPKQRLAFVSAGGDGLVSVIAVGKGEASVVEQVPTAQSARTIGLDPRTGRLYLPSATLGPAPAGGGRRPVLPGTFRLLVLAK